MQQVIGINIDRQVNVHPALHLLCRFVILGHQHIFFIDPDHATGLDQAEQGCHRQQLVTPGADPEVDRHATHA
jgi:hypothetical protein